MKIWSPILEKYLNVKQNIDIIAIRPFVALRSIGCESGFPAITTIGVGDFMEGPSSYPYFAVKHQIVTSAYVRANIHTVGLKYQFNLYLFTKIKNRTSFFFTAR